jgi:PAS domain-containing protein
MAAVQPPPDVRGGSAAAALPRARQLLSRSDRRHRPAPEPERLASTADVPRLGDEQLFSIGEVASMIGVSTHTIRAWERRHRLLTPRRTSRRQRRYSIDDVALLLRVRHLVVANGLSLRVAVRSAQGDLSFPIPDAPIAPAAAPADAAEAEGGASVWRSVADLLPQIIAIVDLGGCVVDGNRAAAVALGLPGEELAGLPLAGLLARVSEGADVSGQLRRAFVEPAGFELRLRTPGGLRRWRFDCRPFAHERTSRVAVIGRPLDG